VSYLGPSLRRVARSRSAGRRVLAALAVSLLLNLFLVTRLDLSWLSAGAGPARAVSMAPLSARDWDANRAVGARRDSPPQARPVPPPTLVVPAPAEPQGQLVKVAPPIDPAKEPPKDARYLAEHNSSVAKETHSRKVGDGNPQAAPKPPKPAEPPAGLAGRSGARELARAEAAKPERKPEAERQAALGLDPSLVPRLPQELRDRVAAQTPAPGQAGPQGQPGAEGAERRLDLRPSAAMYEPPQQAVGSGGSRDYLPGVEEGENTFLNTREWKYAGFLNRIFDEVGQHWHPEVSKAIEARDPTLQRFLYRDRRTELAVKLDGQGHLIDIHVVRESGATFLDEAVKKAWREAQPFANVPRGVLNERGELDIRVGYIVISPSSAPVPLFLGRGN